MLNWTEPTVEVSLGHCILWFLIEISLSVKC